MIDKKTRVMVEIALMVAFSYVLSFVRVVEMPQGGQVSLQMIPLFIVALRLGAGPGMVAGLLFAGLKLLIDPFVVHPVQLLLDYPLAFGAVGLAGFFRKQPLIAIPVGGLARFAMHYLSGVVFFGQYAPEGTSAYLHSFIYNITYIAPEIVLALIIAPLIVSKLPRSIS